MHTATAARSGSSGRAVVRSVRNAPYRAAAVVAAAVAADQVLDPTRTHVPLCPLHALTGIWCPFCGGLRSAYELSRLHFSAAWHDNLAFVVSLPLLFALWIDWTRRSRRGEGRRLVPRTGVTAIVVVLVAFTVVRNLPFGSALRGG
jgi:hypothetical protein